MIEALFSLPFFCCGFLVLAVVAAVIFSWVLGTGTQARQQHEMLELMRQQAMAQGLPVPREESSAKGILAGVFFCLLVYWIWTLASSVEKSPMPPTVAPSERRQRNATTAVTKGSATMDAGEPATEGTEGERPIQNDSRAYRRAKTNAETACASIDTEHVAILRQVLESSKAAGNTRGRAVRIARNWCRVREIMVDGEYGRCISASSKSLWLGSSIPKSVPSRRLSVTVAGRQFLKARLAELDSFKSDPEFHTVGFGACCRFSSWQQSIESKRKAPGFSFLEKVAVGDLELLGLEYLKTKGRENDYTRYARKQVMETIQKR